MYKKVINKDTVPVLLILLGLVLTRLYNLENLFHFTYDESVFAYVGRRMFIGGHIPLIGGVTPFHVHLGPYFYWFSGLFLKLSNFNPIVWGIFTSFFSVGTGLCIYLIVKQVFSKKAAFYSLFLYAFSFSAVVFDRHYWGIVFNPFISITVIFSLYHILNKRYIYYLSLFAGLAFGFHTDPSTVILIIASLITLLYFKIDIKGNKMFYKGFVIFLISFLPLLVFDIKHGFVNVLGIKEYFLETKETASFNLSRLTESFLVIPQFSSRLMYINRPVDLAEEYSYCVEYADNKLLRTSLVLIIISLFFYYLFFIRSQHVDENQKKFTVILHIMILTVLGGTILYKGILGRPFFDHYLTTLIPVFVIIVGVSIDRLFGSKKIAVFMLLLLFLAFNVKTLIHSYHSYSFKTKTEAVRWVGVTINSEFSLDSLSDCFTYNGYRYLFTANGIEPVKSYVDQNFFWLFDKLPEEKHPDTVVVFVGSDFTKDKNLVERYNNYKKNEITSKHFGNLEVIIADNTGEILYDF